MGDLPIVKPAPISVSEAARVREAGDFFSFGELQLTAIIFAFGIAAIVAFIIMSRSRSTTAYTLRIYVVIILIFGTLLVVSSSYATEQIAPVVGFFGTIAGYLLGRSENRDGE